MEINGHCNITGNHAEFGGGVHASSSTINIYRYSLLLIANNSAHTGGGMYLEEDPKLNILGVGYLIFNHNHSSYGGAIYVDDSSTSAACSSNYECFFQLLTLEQGTCANFASSTLFSDNTATEDGSDLFGGVVDRCIPNPFAEVYNCYRTHNFNGITYLGNISNITLGSVASQPVQVCFCNQRNQPDCNYQLPPIKVVKGGPFSVPIVAFDHVYHCVETRINSSLAFPKGGFAEGQQSQKISANCTELVFNVFSPEATEKVTLYADGPCGSSTPSIRHVHVYFLNCTCSVGFEPDNSKPLRCDCKCDSVLSPYIINCNYSTKSLMKTSNSWITYINDTGLRGYVIHADCPFDYCHAQTEKVNFSLPDDVDGQCSYNRTGVLCGTCQQNLTLSLGSSRCLHCHNQSYLVLIAILLGSIVAGILLVSVVLILNMTVAVGMINGIVFYANIVSASSSVVFPSTEPSYPSVLVAWLNLDIGFDVCLFDGLDTYIKTWLQLIFPVYIISLVVTVIMISERSERFTRLIGLGKRDTVATLATLTLLSNAKLLSITIEILSFAILHYHIGCGFQMAMCSIAEESTLLSLLLHV